MSTSADQLIHLIELMQNHFDKLPANISKSAMHQMLAPLAKEMGLDGYLTLATTFNRLVENTKSELDRSVIKEATKDRYTNALVKISGVFDAPNFAQHGSAVFNKHFSESTMDMLHAFSDRIEREGVKQAELDSLREVLSEADKAIQDFCNIESIPENIKAAMRAHLKSLADVIQTYDIFGEDVFWDKYAIILSQMTACYPDLSENEKKIMVKHSESMYAKFRHHLTLSAEVIGIAGAVHAMIPKI